MATWEDPEIVNGLLEGYKLMISTPHLSSEGYSANVSASIHQYVWGNLRPYTAYEVSVAAFTSTGRGPGVVKIIVMPEEGKNINNY